jgi:hypothetical protein
MKIQNFTTEKLIKELKTRGYAVSNLWSENDITTAIEDWDESYFSESAKNLTSIQKTRIMDSVLSSDYLMGETNDMLLDAIKDYLCDLEEEQKISQLSK